MKQLNVIFFGHVQGVGFRYTVMHLSHAHCVAGCIMNKEDGTVELIAEGEKAELDSFLKHILKSPLGSHIRKYNHIFRESTGQYVDFSVRH